MTHNIKQKIVCSGNPDGQPSGREWPHTIAHGVRKFLPDSKFVHTSNGYDLRLWNDQRLNIFRELIKDSDVFINASNVCPGGQLHLLNIAYETIIENKIKDYTIINIGSMAEFDPKQFEMYSIEKNALKERSRQLASKGFRSSHITIDHLDNVMDIGKTIKLVLEHDPFLSMVKIEH